MNYLAAIRQEMGEAKLFTFQILKCIGISKHKKIFCHLDKSEVITVKSILLAGCYYIQLQANSQNFIYI